MTNFYPNKPTKAHRLHRIMQLTGWKPKPFYWQDKTVCDYKDRGEGINRYCTDIRKSTVDKVFATVYGYSSFIDPEGVGRAVIKSEENWAKDGRIVELPYKLKPGEVCQKLIDTWNGEEFVEWRALIVLGSVKGFLRKVKPGRFSSDGAALIYQGVDYVNDASELYRTVKIEEFAQLIGMDYGEIDILFEDGVPFLIDANKTPGGYKWVDKLGEDFVNDHRGLFI